MLRLIHLSDIHFGGYGPGWDPDKDQRDQLLRDIHRLVAAGGRVDAVLVGGDIAYSAAPNEYDEATEWLTEVARLGGCPKGQVWVVPGNHDVNRETHKSSLARQAMLRDLRSKENHEVDKALSDWFVVDQAGSALLACLDAYNNFATEWGACGTSASQPHWTDPTLDLEGLPVYLTGLNTVLVSDTRDNPAGHGPLLLVGTHQSKLELGLESGDRIHIAFGHHPPSWIRDWPEIEPYLRRAHLLLFGHLHEYRAQQRVDRGTVEIRGAVGPDRTGDPNQKLAPSWNLITLERDDDEIIVNIQPRVWFKQHARFGAHPDGDETFRIYVDLERVGEPIAAEGHGGEMHAGANPSPLIPSAAEVTAGVELPEPVERRRRREIGVDFLRLPPTQQMEIAADLGIADGLVEMDLGPRDNGREILRRVREEGLIDALVKRMSDA